MLRNVDCGTCILRERTGMVLQGDLPHQVEKGIAVRLLRSPPCSMEHQKHMVFASAELSLNSLSAKVSLSKQLGRSPACPLKRLPTVMEMYQRAVVASEGPHQLLDDLLDANINGTSTSMDLRNWPRLVKTGTWIWLRNGERKTRINSKSKNSPKIRLFRLLLSTETLRLWSI